MTGDTTEWHDLRWWRKHVWFPYHLLLPPCHIYYAYNIPALTVTDRKAKRHLLSCIPQQPNGPPEILSAYRLTCSCCLHTPYSLTFSSSWTSRGQHGTSPEPTCFSQRPRDTRQEIRVIQLAFGPLRDRGRKRKNKLSFNLGPGCRRNNG